MKTLRYYFIVKLVLKEAYRYFRLKNLTLLPCPVVLLVPRAMSRSPRRTGALAAVTAQGSAEDAQQWPQDVITVTIEIDEAIRGTSVMQKRRGLPPHVRIIESLNEMGLKPVKLIPSKFRQAYGVEELKTVFTDYEEFLKGMDAETRLNEILADWKYVCWRTSTNANKMNFVINISPIAQPRAYGLVDAIMKLLNLKVNGSVEANGPLLVNGCLSSHGFHLVL